MWQVLKDLRGIFTTDGKRQEGMDSVRRKQIPRAMRPRFGMTIPNRSSEKSGAAQMIWAEHLHSRHFRRPGNWHRRGHQVIEGLG